MKRRRPSTPMTSNLDRHIFAKRPRCKRCGGADLRTYKSLPKDGDSIVRYVRCCACGREYILMLD
jgi:hypothetical protein